MESIRPKIQFIVDLYFRICDFSIFLITIPVLKSHV